MKARDIAALFGLVALWGASFLFNRIASPAIGPIPTIEGRVTIAAVALLIYIFMIGQSTGWGQLWKQYLIIHILSLFYKTCFS